MDTGIMVESLPILGTCSLCLSEGVVKSMLIKKNSETNLESYTDMLLKCFSIDMGLLDLDDTKCLICNSCINQLESSLKFKEQVETSLNILEASIKIKKAEQEAYECIKKEILELENNGTQRKTLKNVKEKLAAVIGLSRDNYVDDDSDSERLVFSNVKQESLNDSDSDGHRRTQKKSLKNVKEKLAAVIGLSRDNYVDDESDTERLVFSNVKEESPNTSDSDDHTLLKDLIKKEPHDYKPGQTRKKSLSTSKKKHLYSSKKQKELKETEKMLERGLFPFKISKNQMYSCAVCPEKSPILDDIKSHIMEHSTSNITLAFKKMISLNLQIFYKSSTKLRCKICKTEVSDYENLKRHIHSCDSSSSRWNNLPFKLEKDQLDCPICKKNFLNFVSLNTHMNVHYPNHICDSCGKAFASKARLRGHMRTHEIGDFPCRYCDAVFDRVTKRENHVSKEHKSGIRYACKRCNISLSSFYARQKHLAEVHNEELKRYKCKACTQSYITPGHLSSHVRRDHLNERNHKCSKCDLAFYTRNSLKMHMIKHDGERIHTCHICHKSYQRKKTLREHMRIHNNDKRFVCPVCGRAFTQKCTLKGHMKVHERKVDSFDRVAPPLHSI